jgi:periplasmic protein CpxP/Spy
MRKIFLLMAMMTSGAIIYAQNHEKDPAHRATRQTEKMKAALSLDPQQYASVKDINDKFAKRISDVKHNDGIAQEEKRVILTKMKREKNAELSNVLSAEQQKTWRNLKEQKHKEKKGRKASRKHAKAELGLTPDQESRMRAEHIAFKQKQHELKREEKVSKTETNQKRKALAQEHREHVRQILTEDQFTKWEVIKKNHKHKKK